MVHCKLDHLVVAARTLEDGIAHVERLLGVTAPFGGRHPLMGTHNALMQFGPTCFLEIIAIDPDAEPPARPRWFALDDPDIQETIANRPRLLTWVCRTTNLEALVAASTVSPGPVEEGRRGDLVWHITIPEDGSMPMNGAFPTLIQWPEHLGPSGAAPHMNDLGCTLESLTLSHPAATKLKAALASISLETDVTVESADTPGLSARIACPNGIVTLK